MSNETTHLIRSNQIQVIGEEQPRHILWERVDTLTTGEGNGTQRVRVHYRLTLDDPMFGHRTIEKTVRADAHDLYYETFSLWVEDWRTANTEVRELVEGLTGEEEA